MARSPVYAVAAIVALCACATIDAAAITFHVAPDGSGDYPTIQQALAAGDSGDVIELLDGIYVGDENHNLDFLGKGIVLCSQSGDPTQCVIDCSSGGGDPDITHRGFEFHNGEDSTAVVRGITILNGAASGT